MTQSDIYRLLLTVLLFANRQLSSLNAPSAGSDNRSCGCFGTAAQTDNAANPASTDGFSFSGINDLMIIVMFASLFSPDGTTSGTTF